MVIPIYQDTETKSKQIIFDNIFCCGMAGTHVTFGAEDVDMARFLFDSFTPLIPILNVISVSTPAIGGLLSGWDSRWDIWIQGMNDWTKQELADQPLLPSRWFNRREYISDHPFFQDDSLMDAPEIPINNEFVEQLVESGVPRRMARHAAYFVTHPYPAAPKGWTEVDETDTGLINTA